MRRNVHDAGLPVGVQVTSIRLLLNLVEVMFGRRGDARTAEVHRAMLARCLDACVAKLAAVQRQLPRLLAPGGHL